MTANPKSPQARLDAIACEKAEQRRASGNACGSYLSIFPLVALDLLQERDALKDKLDAAEADLSAHAATKEELRKAEETIQQQARELEEVDEAIIKAADSEDAELVMERIYQVAVGRQSHRAAEAAVARQASINRPADKQPTNDRGEGEAK